VIELPGTAVLQPVSTPLSSRRSLKVTVEKPVVQSLQSTSLITFNKIVQGPRDQHCEQAELDSPIEGLDNRCEELQREIESLQVFTPTLVSVSSAPLSRISSSSSKDEVAVMGTEMELDEDSEPVDRYDLPEKISIDTRRKQSTKEETADSSATEQQDVIVHDDVEGSNAVDININEEEEMPPGDESYCNTDEGKNP
jgi:hypothetical protein